MEDEQHELDEKRAKKLKKKRDKLQDEALMADLQIDVDELKALKKKLSKVAPRAERGVETLFRLVSKNQYTLGTMVDRKSNILISINALILSIVLGTVMSQLEDDPHLIVPIILILITNLSSIALAVFATRPELSHGKVQGNATVTNFLFYGNYHTMKEQEYTEGLMGLIHQGDELYRTIAHDSFHMGKVLEKKFRFLRKSFDAFLWGIIISVATFIMCHLMALMGLV